MNNENLTNKAEAVELAQTIKEMPEDKLTLFLVLSSAVAATHPDIQPKLQEAFWKKDPEIAASAWVKAARFSIDVMKSDNSAIIQEALRSL